MERRSFIKAGITMMLSLPIKDLLAALPKSSTARMPVMFVGHGNPMNAIVDNSFSRAWRDIGKSLPSPSAILCISAHWETFDTKVTMHSLPPTIHDFGGFPKELFDAQYPAPGATDMAQLTIETLGLEIVHPDLEWGLDHGTWSVLKPMFPEAKIPVFQMSLSTKLNAAGHYQLGRQLDFLRSRGVLIIGSGNVVHNLGMLKWSGGRYDWAIEFDALVKKHIENFEHGSLINFDALGQAAKLSIPTPDHYLPLLYVLGLTNNRDRIAFFNESMDLGSISMRSFIAG